jgi:hypothetical protein
MIKKIPNQYNLAIFSNKIKNILSKKRFSNTFIKIVYNINESGYDGIYL